MFDYFWMCILDYDVITKFMISKNLSCKEPWIIEEYFKHLLIVLVLSERASKKLVWMRLVETESYRKGESTFEEDFTC